MKQMATMDLSVIHKNQGEAMSMQTRLTTDFKNHVYKIKEPFQKTDVKGNNNKLSCVKTETNNDLGSYSPTSLCRDVIHKGENKMEMEDSFFNYSSFKKAMDLRIHSRKSEPKKRTIFDDADYFAKNHLYKLLPITFEHVDETIIHTEHNYCHFSLSSESETEEDCSRTMDYSQIKEKNYKKRKAKLGQFMSSNKPGGNDCEEERKTNGNGSCVTREGDCSGESENLINRKCLEGNCFVGQALDLSAPLVQEEKTDHCLREHQPKIANKLEAEKEDGGEFDSDKENLSSNLNLIEVTITRPDEKENYQPCDLFLNDIARLVPRLIGKDCFEIDILDRTCERHLDIDKHRLYYIISESTWRLFQSTKERVILTNDQSLVQPVQKAGRDERPTFLVFDQFSLAKCLADYCKEIGGSFEYTCVEESKEGAALREEEEDEEKVEGKGGGETEMRSEDKEETVEALTKDNEDKECEEKLNETEEEKSLSIFGNGKNNYVDMQHSVTPDKIKVEETTKKVKVEEEKERGGGGAGAGAGEAEEKLGYGISKDSNDSSKETEEKGSKLNRFNVYLRRIERHEEDKTKKAGPEDEKNQISQDNQHKNNAENNKTLKRSRSKKKNISIKKTKGDRKAKSKVKSRQKNLKVPETEKNSKSKTILADSQIRTRSKSTSASEGYNDLKPFASQKSDKPKMREWRGRKGKQAICDGKLEETSKKLEPFHSSQPLFLERKTRSGKTIPEPENKSSGGKKQPSESSKQNNLENSKERGRKRKAEENEAKTEIGLNLRSRARKTQKGESHKVLSRVRKK